MIRIADPKPTPDHLVVYSGRELDAETGLHFHLPAGSLPAGSGLKYQLCLLSTVRE